MKAAYIFNIAFIILSASAQFLDVDLIFYLKEYLNSNLILLCDFDNSVGSAKLLYKDEKMSAKGFIGIINSKERLNKLLKEPPPMARFRNSILLLKNNSIFYELIHAQTDPISNVLASVIWIIFIHSDMDPQNVEIQFNWRIFLIQEKISSYEITEIYEGNKKMYGYEKGRKKLVEKKIQPRIDLQGHKFNVSQSTVRISSLPEKKNEHEELWKLFSQHMNFTINWIKIPPSGALYSNGTKTGLFQLIENHTIDGTPNNYVVTKERLDHFDFIWPALLTETKIYVEVKHDLNWVSFIAPFHLTVWISIIVWIILASFVKRLTIPKTNQQDSLLSTFKAVCSQGGEIQETTISYYISYLMPYLLSGVILEYYSGALLSYLTVKNSEPLFQSLEGVIKNGEYKIAVVNITFAYFYFNNDNDENALQVRNGLLVPAEQQPVNTTSGFPLICKHKWVFLATSLGIEIKEDCDIVELSDSVFSHSLGIMTWKGFPYQKAMTTLMRRLQFGGFFKWKTKNVIIQNENLDNFEPLPLKSVFFILLLYLGFILISVLVFFYEKITVK